MKWLLAFLLSGLITEMVAVPIPTNNAKIDADNKEGDEAEQPCVEMGTYCASVLSPHLGEGDGGASQKPAEFDDKGVGRPQQPEPLNQGVSTKEQPGDGGAGQKPEGVDGYAPYDPIIHGAWKTEAQEELEKMCWSFCESDDEKECTLGSGELSSSQNGIQSLRAECSSIAGTVAMKRDLTIETPFEPLQGDFKLSDEDFPSPSNIQIGIKSTRKILVNGVLDRVEVTCISDYVSFPKHLVKADPSKATQFLKAVIPGKAGKIIKQLPDEIVNAKRMSDDKMKAEIHGATQKIYAHSSNIDANFAEAESEVTCLIEYMRDLYRAKHNPYAKKGSLVVNDIPYRSTLGPFASTTERIENVYEQAMAGITKTDLAEDLLSFSPDLFEIGQNKEVTLGWEHLVFPGPNGDPKSSPKTHSTIFEASEGSAYGWKTTALSEEEEGGGQDPAGPSNSGLWYVGDSFGGARTELEMACKVENIIAEGKHAEVEMQCKSTNEGGASEPLSTQGMILSDASISNIWGATKGFVNWAVDTPRGEHEKGMRTILLPETDDVSILPGYGSTVADQLEIRHASDGGGYTGDFSVMMRFVTPGEAINIDELLKLSNITQLNVTIVNKNEVYIYERTGEPQSNSHTDGTKTMKTQERPSMEETLVYSKCMQGTFVWFGVSLQYISLLLMTITTVCLASCGGQIVMLMKVYFKETRTNGINEMNLVVWQGNTASLRGWKQCARIGKWFIAALLFAMLAGAFSVAGTSATSLFSANLTEREVICEAAAYDTMFYANRSRDLIRNEVIDPPCNFLKCATNAVAHYPINCVAGRLAVGVIVPNDQQGQATILVQGLALGALGGDFHRCLARQTSGGAYTEYLPSARAAPVVMKNIPGAGCGLECNELCSLPIHEEGTGLSKLQAHYNEEVTLTKDEVQDIVRKSSIVSCHNNHFFCLGAAREMTVRGVIQSLNEGGPYDTSPGSEEHLNEAKSRFKLFGCPICRVAIKSILGCTSSDGTRLYGIWNTDPTNTLTSGSTNIFTQGVSAMTSTSFWVDTHRIAKECVMFPSASDASFSAEIGTWSDEKIQMTASICAQACDMAVTARNSAGNSLEWSKRSVFDICKKTAGIATGIEGFPPSPSFASIAYTQVTISGDSMTPGQRLNDENVARVHGTGAAVGPYPGIDSGRLRSLTARYRISKLEAESEGLLKELERTVKTNRDFLEVLEDLSIKSQVANERTIEALLERRSQDQQAIKDMAYQKQRLERESKEREVDDSRFIDALIEEDRVQRAYVEDLERQLQDLEEAEQFDFFSEGSASPRLEW